MPFTIQSAFNPPAPSLGDRLFSQSLLTPGSVNFVLDYSELSAPGTHTFYVQRTQGSVGAISVDWASSGDTHTVSSGTLNWANGDMGYKAITVAVPSKTVNGDHRIVVNLSNATGGAAETHGARAYGIIDDGTVAPDSDAIFYDSAAGGGGNGTQASPYNSIYTAISNIGARRYLYGRGTTTVDTTQTINPNGGGGVVGCIYIPSGRTSEATRLFIQNWPGSTWTVTGGASTSRIGFYSNGPGNIGDASYTTFKGIDFTSLNASGVSFAEGGAISFMGFGSGQRSSYINVEQCTGDNINGSSNTALFNPYNLLSSKMWRCTSNNIQVNGSNTNGNSGGLCLYYDASDLSIGRCSSTLSGSGCYFKGIYGATTRLPKVSFCNFDAAKGLDVGFAASNNYSQDLIATDCIFRDTSPDAGRFENYGIYARGNAASATGRHYVARNVFYNSGGSGNGAIYFHDSFFWQIADNIFQDGSRAWDDFKASGAQQVVEDADFNHTFSTSSGPYKYQATSYASAAAVNAVNNVLCGNDTAGDPLFVNPAGGDFSFPNNSPCYQTGMGGYDKGPSDLTTIGA